MDAAVNASPDFVHADDGVCTDSLDADVALQELIEEYSCLASSLHFDSRSFDVVNHVSDEQRF